MKNYKFCPICQSSLVRKKHEGDYRLSCSGCKWIHYDNPLPSVAALVINEKQEVLLIKRGVAPSKGKWALPTGFIEQHETPEEAVVRELKEEAGVSGVIRGLVGVYTEHTRMYGNVLLIGYDLRITTGSPKSGSDTVAVKYFPLNRLPGIPFASHRAVIRDGLSSSESVYIEVLKSKITEAKITHTQLFYKGSMGIDSAVLKKANLLPGEKVQVLNYNNGERLETYVIAEKAGSGRMVLYGPAAKKGSVGDRLCILSYQLMLKEKAHSHHATVLVLNSRNRIKRRIP